MTDPHQDGHERFRVIEENFGVSSDTPKISSNISYPIYKFRGKEYQIIDERGEGIKQDFLYCESIGDWKTIENRIVNGLLYKWMVAI